MSDKEILAELKKSYEYLTDIRENGAFDHCNGQLNKEMSDMINIARKNIEDVYFIFYKTLNKEDLRVKSLEDDEKVYIASSVDGDYEVGKDSYNMTCVDANYYWYNDNDFIDLEINDDEKYYATIWITENDREQGFADKYDKDFKNLKDAIEDLRTYFEDGNCVCVEIYNSNDELQYNCDKESEEFYMDDLKIVKVNQDIIDKYIDNWSDNKKLPTNDNLLYCESNENQFLAINNTTGDCWTEEFDNEESAIKWLLGMEKEIELE